MVETILKNLRTSMDMEGKLDVDILDQGDAVGAWYNSSLLVVLFPTGDTLPKVWFVSGPCLGWLQLATCMSSKSRACLGFD
jgi:hypothetical protein